MTQTRSNRLGESFEGFRATRARTLELAGGLAQSQLDHAPSISAKAAKATAPRG